MQPNYWQKIKHVTYVVMVQLSIKRDFYKGPDMKKVRF